MQPSAAVEELPAEGRCTWLHLQRLLMSASPVVELEPGMELIFEGASIDGVSACGAVHAAGGWGGQ